MPSLAVGIGLLLAIILIVLILLIRRRRRAGGRNKFVEADKPSGKDDAHSAIERIDMNTTEMKRVSRAQTPDNMSSGSTFARNGEWHKNVW